MNRQQLYWRVFNFAVRRVFAVAAVVAGSTVSLSSLPALLDPTGTVLVNGVPESDIVYRLLAVLYPAVFAVGGLLLYCSRPYVGRMDQR